MANQGASRLRNALITNGGRLPFVEAAARRVLRSGSLIFMFHRVLPYGEDCYEAEMATSTVAFQEILDWMAENFQVLALEDLVRHRGTSVDSKKPACAITFDDGWVDNFVHAFPLLLSRRLPATIFLPVQFIGTQRRFWQERLWLCVKELQLTEFAQTSIEEVARHFPWFPLSPEVLSPDGRLKRFLMTRPSEEAEEFVQHLTEFVGSQNSPGRAFMNWDEVEQMAKSGISFGSHTLHHVLLTQMEPEHAITEIRESRRELQERLGSEVPAFSYPWGAANSISRDAVRDTGYRYAVGTNPGLITGDADPWLLPRMAISNSILRTEDHLNSGSVLLSCAKNVIKARLRHKTRRAPRERAGRIRIVFVIDQISEWEGGTERQLHTLISALDRKYFDPRLCFILRVPGFPEETLPCEATWISDDPQNVPSLATRVMRLALYLRKTRPHIVQTFFIEGIFAGILAAKLAGVPKIVGSARNAGYWKKMRHRFAFRTVAPLADQWQCNSRALWEYTNKTEGVAPGRIEILPNALDLSRFRPVQSAERLASRRELGLHENGHVFVSIANFTPVKDIKTLLQAVANIKERVPEAQILIVGEGPLRKELEEQSEALGLAQMVRFTGRQSDVQLYLAAADFGVLTSLSEGSSNSVLEYMAMGLPSVVSDIAPNRELVNALFFTPGSAHDLADKLLLIGKDTELCSQLRSEYLASALQFGFRRFAMRVQSYYNKLNTRLY